jgi:hypothetical protein
VVCIGLSLWVASTGIATGSTVSGRRDAEKGTPIVLRRAT